MKLKPTPMHDTFRHVVAGGFGVPVEGCPACHPEPTPGACEEKVAEVGFSDGHDWAKIAPYVFINPEAADRSVALYCKRCGENGWLI